MLKSEYLVFDEPIGTFDRAPEPLPCTLRWYEPADMATLIRHGFWRIYIRQRLARGARIVIAENSGEVVGWNFFQTGDCDTYSFLTLALPPDAMGIGGAYVVPAFRGRRIIDAVNRFGAAHFSARGISRIVHTIDATNAPSLRSPARRGNAAAFSIIRQNHLLWQTAQIVPGAHPAMPPRSRIGIWNRLHRLRVHLPEQSRGEQTARGHDGAPVPDRAAR